MAQAASIGVISSLTGSATVTTAAGDTVAARPGLAISLEDRIETGPDGRLEIDFTDGTVFAMAPNSEMEVAKFVDNPDGADSGLIIDFARGAFEFVAGRIAHMFGDGMQVATPAGTLGVRGTAGAAAQDPATGEWTFMLLKDPDGHLGKIVLINAAGEVLLDEWMEASVLAGADDRPTTPRILSTDDVRAIFGETTGMIPELRDQAPVETPEESNQGQAEEPAAPVDTADVAITPVVISDNGLSIAAISAGAQTIANNIGLTQNAPGAEASGLLDNIGGLFDDIFESPLIPMPGHTPNIDAPAIPQPIYVNGTAGNDVLHGGPGEHIVNGGAGVDTMDYSSPSAPHGINVTLASGSADDDGFGGKDTLVSIENVVGTLHGDYIDGRGGGTNILNGLAGDDVLYGDGSDHLIAGSGNDKLFAPTPTSGSISGDTGNADYWNIIDSANDTVDLSSAPVIGIERIDLGLSNGSGVTLSVADVLSISDNDTLAIFGDADNAVVASGGWTPEVSTIIDGQTMNVWTSGGATLYVDADITNVIVS